MSPSIIATTNTTKQVTRTNSIMLNSYLKIKRDDKVMIPDVPKPKPRISSSMKISSPISVVPHHHHSPIIPSPPTHSVSPKDHSLPSFQSKSVFASKFNQRQRGEGALLARQSMPIVSNQYQQHLRQQQQEKQDRQEQGSTSHVHNLIECSFPKGKTLLLKTTTTTMKYFLKTNHFFLIYI